MFRGRDWQTHFPDEEPVTATIGNGSTSDISPVGWRMSNRREDIVTQVVIARETDETPVEYNSATGQTLYGIETWEALDLVCTSAVQMQRVALRLLRTRGYEVTPRVDGVLFDAATSDAALDLMTGLIDVFLPTRFRCRHILERGEVFDLNMFATGVTHRMSPERWECDVNLDLSGPWEAVGGDWDDASWDLNVWSATV